MNLCQTRTPNERRLGTIALRMIPVLILCPPAAKRGIVVGEMWGVKPVELRRAGSPG